MSFRSSESNLCSDKRCKGVSGGIQLIPIGDFFQLAPVKSPNNEGKYCFCQPTGT